MKSKRVLALVMALAMMLVALTGCGGAASSTAPAAPAAPAASGSEPATPEFPTMHLQLGHVNPTTDDDQYHKYAVLFTEKITAATNGAITFDICGV